jgi:hypothetical protein
MSIFLFDGGPRRSWPREIGLGARDGDELGPDDDPGAKGGQIKGGLPKGWDVLKTKQAILDRHPALRKAWGRRLGYRLMFLESEILIAVLQELASLGIPALGLHDGLLVPLSKKDVAGTVMERTAKAMNGVAIPVTIKA